MARIIFFILISQGVQAQDPSTAPGGAPADAPADASAVVAPGAAPLPPPPGLPPPPAPPEGTPDLGSSNEIPILEEDPNLAKKPTNRDPFAKPSSYMKRMEEEKLPLLDPSVYIDNRIEPIRRWPIRNYILVGIIFDVESPKAMVKDPESNMHMLTTNQRIGNQEGTITKIERGELIIEENKKTVKLKLQK